MLREAREAAAAGGSGKSGGGSDSSSSSSSRVSCGREVSSSVVGTASEQKAAAAAPAVDSARVRGLEGALMAREVVEREPAPPFASALQSATVALQHTQIEGYAPMRPPRRAPSIAPVAPAAEKFIMDYGA